MQLDEFDRLFKKINAEINSLVAQADGFRGQISTEEKRRAKSDVLGEQIFKEESDLDGKMKRYAAENNTRAVWGKGAEEMTHDGKYGHQIEIVTADHEPLLADWAPCWVKISINVCRTKPSTRAFMRCHAPSCVVRWLRRYSQSHKTRKPRTRGKDRRGQTPNLRLISERPQEVQDRQIPGHWEGDLVKRKGNKSAIGTLVERTSRYVILVRLDNATSPVVTGGFVREMTDHKTVSASLNLDVYFADPPPHTQGEE